MVVYLLVVVPAVELVWPLGPICLISRLVPDFWARQIQDGSG